MYIKTKCPTCGGSVCLDLLIQESVRPAYAESEIIDVQVMDACTASELARDVLKELSGYVYDGISREIHALKAWVEVRDIITQAKLRKGK